MPLVQVDSGFPTGWLTDQPQNLMGGRMGEAMVAELHGKYFTQNYRGKLWHAALTAASAVPVFATNATPNWAIWNPAGNSTAVVLTRMNFGFSAGTGIAGQIGYAYLPNAGAAIGTAAPMSAVTTGTITMGVVGQTYSGQVKFLTAATLTGTGISALTNYRYSCVSQGAPITSTAAMYNLWEDFDGTVIIPPNTLFCVVASTAIAETGMIAGTAYEIPYP